MANFPDSDTKVVLVVDDDPLVRGRVAGILAEAGFDVMTAGDNQEALAIVRIWMIGSDSSWSARTRYNGLPRLVIDWAPSAVLPLVSRLEGR